MRREVRELLRPLQGLRQDGPSPARDRAALVILRRLGCLHMSVSCLKSTKVAAELNSACWKAPGFSAEVRNLAASLVRNWRALFRSENGGDEASAMSEAARSRQCQNLSMDLENNCYATLQRSAQYIALVQGLCRRIGTDPEIIRGLLAGTMATKDLVKQIAGEVRMRDKAFDKVLPRF